MNRQKADRVLAGAFALFLTAAFIRWLHRDAVWAQAIFVMAEASLVGGIADWFAVTALFERPLGVTFHTAIIPRNRERIVQSMAYMVQEEFLSRQSIQGQLQKVRLVSLLIGWMDRGGKEAVLALFRRALESWSKKADRSDLARFAASAVRGRVLTMELHRYAPVIAHWLIASGNSSRLFELALSQARIAFSKPSIQREIHEYLVKTAREATGESTIGRIINTVLRAFDVINFEQAAAAIYERLLSELAEMEKADHPLRLWLDQKLAQSLSELERNTDWQNTLADWKKGVLERIPIEDVLQPVIHEMLSAEQPDSQTGEPANIIIAGILRFAAKYWEVFRQDTVLQDWLERHLQEAVAEVVLSEHKQIGELVGQALGNLSDEELNGFIEDKVGQDLAWIRVNGSVVGALAGLAVFFIGQYLYLPYVWPVLRSLLSGDGL